MGTPINQEDNKLGLGLIFQLIVDPTIVAYSAPIGAIGILANPNGSFGVFQKMDEGKTTNWGKLLNAVSLSTSDIANDSSVTGLTAKDALNTLGTSSHTHLNKTQLDTFLKSLDSSAIGDQKALVYDLASDKLIYKTVGGGGAASNPIKWYDIFPQDGKVLPISQPRAYYTTVLYNAVASFKDPLGTLRKYVAYYGAAASGQGYAAFSDDGITFDNETLVTGITGVGYHSTAIVVSGIIHLFYWQGSVIYTPASIYHATFDPSVSCVASTSNNPLSGNYITGVIGDGLRYGTYGPDQVFYNAAPTNNPANPYSYQWCMIHNGIHTGTNEGILFATSSDGLNFSAWNGVIEVIPRGTLTDWDLKIGGMCAFIDSNNLWHSFYSGGLGTENGEDTNFGGGLGYATSIDGITWKKWDKNPVIRKTESMKTWKRLYNAWVIKDGVNYKLYFSCKNNAGTYVTAYAILNGFI